MERNKYKDILVIVIGFSVIGLIFRLEWFGYAALIIGALTVFSEKIATWVTTGWSAFGKALGRINSTILLTVLFTLLLTPIALLKRWTSGKARQRGLSNWEASTDKVDFSKLW